MKIEKGRKKDIYEAECFQTEVQRRKNTSTAKTSAFGLKRKNEIIRDVIFYSKINRNKYLKETMFLMI